MDDIQTNTRRMKKMKQLFFLLETLSLFDVPSISSISYILSLIVRVVSLFVILLPVSLSFRVFMPVSFFESFVLLSLMLL
jgi:hypothetical protein